LYDPRTCPAPSSSAGTRTGSNEPASSIGSNRHCHANDNSDRPDLAWIQDHRAKAACKNGENIGSIRDLLVTGDHVQQYVIGLGGTLAGIGEKNHLIEPSKLSFENDVKGNLQAKIALTKDEVQQLAEYKY